MLCTGVDLESTVRAGEQASVLASGELVKVGFFSCQGGLKPSPFTQE